jgi:hypothetical protein
MYVPGIEADTSKLPVDVLMDDTWYLKKVPA